jgi:hypothetical protein
MWQEAVLLAQHFLGRTAENHEESAEIRTRHLSNTSQKPYVSAILLGDTSNTVRHASVAFAGVNSCKALDSHSGAARFEFQQGYRLS